MHEYAFYTHSLPQNVTHIQNRAAQCVIGVSVTMCVL